MVKIEPLQALTEASSTVMTMATVDTELPTLRRLARIAVERLSSAQLQVQCDALAQSMTRMSLNKQERKALLLKNGDLLVCSTGGASGRMTEVMRSCTDACAYAERLLRHAETKASESSLSPEKTQASESLGETKASESLGETKASESLGETKASESSLSPEKTQALESPGETKASESSLTHEDDGEIEVAEALVNLRKEDGLLSLAVASELLTKPKVRQFAVRLMKCVSSTSMDNWVEDYFGFWTARKEAFASVVWQAHRYVSSMRGDLLPALWAWIVSKEDAIVVTKAGGAHKTNIFWVEKDKKTLRGVWMMRLSKPAKLIDDDLHLTGHMYFNTDKDLGKALKSRKTAVDLVIGCRTGMITVLDDRVSQDGMLDEESVKLLTRIVCESGDDEWV